MRSQIDDLTIDKVLAEHNGDEQLSAVLKRLSIIIPPNTNWPWDLRNTGLFELYGAPDYLKLTPLGQKIKRAGGWLKHIAPTMPLFDRIISSLFDLQDTGKRHNLFELFPDVDKGLIREKVKELSQRKLIDIEPPPFHSAVYFGSEVLHSQPQDPKSKEARRKKYENELNAKIRWEGIQYVKGGPVHSSSAINFNDQSTSQQINDSIIHGSVKQSDHSPIKTINNGAAASGKGVLKNIGEIVGILGGVATVILFFNWLLTQCG